MANSGLGWWKQRKVCNQRWKGARSLTLFLMQHLIQSITPPMPPLLCSWTLAHLLEKRLLMSPPRSGVLPHVTKVLQHLLYITPPLIRLIHTYLYSQLNIIIFSFKVLFSSVVKFITSSWNCKYAPNLLILRYNFHSCHPLAPQSHQNVLLSSTLLLIFFNINTS